MVCLIFSFLRDHSAYNLTEIIQKNQDKYLPQVVFSNKTLTLEKVNTLGKSSNMNTNFVFSRNMTYKYELHGMSLKYHININ